jgi:penicillin V acylase-like amidase (Ntn superfamily)
MKRFKSSVISLIICSVFAVLPLTADACSRFTYTGPNNMVVTGRSMDWVEDLHTDLWVFPAGIENVGSNEPNSIRWTSKYGSVIASAYDIGTADGINSKGLVANLLYLSTSDYGKPRADRKNISIFTWTQYFLDNYATVDEAVKDFGQDQFNMIGPKLPNGANPNVHLSITDRTGDNAIFEYVSGKLVVHHNKAYKVMTNEPVYEKQLALNDYWQNLKGVFLPGTGEPEDRFVRASYYLNTAQQTADTQKSIAIVFSIIRNVSVPMLEGSSTRPNVSSTLWRSVADLKNNVYYFENTDRPNVFWVDMSKLDLMKGATIKKLPLKNGEIYAGDVSSKFVVSKSFFAK